MLFWELSGIAFGSGNVGVLEVLLFDPYILQQTHAVDPGDRKSP